MDVLKGVGGVRGGRLFIYASPVWRVATWWSINKAVACGRQ